ncbi:armadillo repeat-containing protein 5 [Ischnura elegans]|uniref:armadillo repeat-containing protein 5 n=1 Tax=Ischnura elegans TaxID=197161 RepID=UPI001ED88107|nr:armadillo repeat-containing protein 5 [Ischnura elegans]
MDINKNDKLVQKLGCSSPSVVYQALVEIRTKEVNSANGVALLRKRGILKYFVRLLQKPNEKIIDVTLSILGNCCLETESCLELWRIGAVGPIVRILDGIGKDSIQGRTCRVLANLSQHQEIATVVCREGAIPILIEILKPTPVNDGKSKEANSSSDMTKEMAIRALRLLGENSECRGEIVNQGGVRAVAELILSDCSALQKAAMKALATLTQYCTDECALQVQGDGACFERLVSLVEVPVLGDDSATIKSPSSVTQSALTCLSNLAHSSEARPLLGNAGAIPAVIGQLQYLSNLDLSNEYKLRGLVSTLCLFTRESVNRLKLRDQGGLNQLMIHLKVDKHGPVAAALCNFAFDDNAFRQLIDHGLINVCADRLKGSISVKFEEKLQTHPFRPKTQLREEGQKRRNSLQIPNASPAARARYRQASVEDSLQFSLPSSLDIKPVFSPEGCGKKLLKSPVKAAPQKTFRISSPSYQAVRYEQEGHRSMSLWSPPASSGDCSGSSCASPECNLSSSPSNATFPWGGVNSSLSVSGFLQTQNPFPPTLFPSSVPQFQDGPLSPETSSSCSGGSLSSCTSGYASSPRSDLSDAPSPGYSGAVGAIDEIYSPVYEDVSDDSGQEDCEGAVKEEHSTLHVVSTSNKRSRTENDNGKTEDIGESMQKKKCSSRLESRASTSSFSFEKMHCSLSNDAVEETAVSSVGDDDEMLTKEEHLGNGGEESEKPKNVKTHVDYLLRLLYHATQCEEPVTDLASHNTFSALLGFHLVYPDPQSRYGLIASRILSRIVRNEHYLIPLISQKFVPIVRSWFCHPALHKEEKTSEKSHQVPGKKDIDIRCAECLWLQTFGTSILVDLGKSAESGYGEGELAYGLLKGDSSLRMAIALSLPFIIRSKRIMNKLLFGCNGLIALLGILKDLGNSAIKCDGKSVSSEKCGDENESKSDGGDVNTLKAVVDGLSYLAGFMGMKVVKSHPLRPLEEEHCQPDGILFGASTSDQVCFKKTVDEQSTDCDKVMFTLDDGSSIVTSREGMSNISPMFRAMLQGSFEESEGASVKLPGVSLSCLSYIMHYLGECRDTKCRKKRANSLHSLGKNQNERTFFRSPCPWAGKPKEVYGALELVSVADRFLLPNSFCKKLANQVLDFYLCPESAASIYMWCLGTEGISGSKAPEDLGLLEGTVKYILVGCMTLHERVSMIQSVFSRGFGEELVSHINDLFRIYFE